MEYVIILIFIFGIVSVSSEQDFGLDKADFQKLVEEEHKAQGPKDDIFTNHMWKHIVDYFPKSAVIPALEHSYPDEDNEQQPSYSCHTESHIWPKLGSILEKKSTALPNKKKINMEIVAQLKVEKPMEFDLVAKSEGPDKLYGPVKVVYLFGEHNEVKLNLEIPDFSQGRTTLTSECLVIFNSIQVIGMSVPQADQSKVPEDLDKDAPYHYWHEMASEGSFLRIVTSGLMRAMGEQLKQKEKSWICVSEDFRKKVSEMRDYNYGENYKTYCNGVKAKIEP